MGWQSRLTLQECRQSQRQDMGAYEDCLPALLAAARSCGRMSHACSCWQAGMSQRLLPGLRHPRQHAGQAANTAGVLARTAVSCWPGQQMQQLGRHRAVLPFKGQQQRR